MFEHNRAVYRAQRIVQHYSELRQLQPAERAILELLREEWPQIKMLDIGVGGGRTTQYFSELAAEYTGIDYSEEMIAACQKRFSPSQSRTLEVGDARKMSQFEDNSFDFILFSFNGLDVLSHSDRLQVLQEVSRVGKPGGYFLFSSHNIQVLERDFDGLSQICCNPLKTYVNVMMFALLRLFNRLVSLRQIRESDYEIIRDESHNFRLKQYYIRPQAQLNQLASNFEAVKTYAWNSGSAIKTMQELNLCTEVWLYYFCRIKQAANTVSESDLNGQLATDNSIDGIGDGDFLDYDKGV